MTQLERELIEELKLQRELFRRELERVTSQYEANLRTIGSRFQNIIDEQTNIIENQSESYKIKLQQQSNQLLLNFDQMQQSLISKLTLLHESLEELSDGLKKLENQYKGLKMS